MNKPALFLPGVFLFLELQAFAQTSNAPLRFWAPPIAPRVHYKIEGSIQSTSTLDAKFAESIDFTNTTGTPIQHLTLNGVSECEHEPEIAAQGHALETVFRDEQGKILSPISPTLTPPVSPNATLHLDIKTSCHFNNKTPDEEISQPWYPQIWWGHRTGDDYDVKMTAPQGYVLFTSGRPDPKTGWNHQENVRDFGLFSPRMCRL